MKTLFSLPVLSAILALLFASPARAEFPLVSTTSVAGAVSGSVINRLAQNPASGDVYAAGLIMAGAGNSNIWIGRYSSGLVLQSSYTYDKAGFADAALGVTVDTTTNDVYAAGYVSSDTANSSRDMWLARFNSSLVLQSSITVDGSASDRDEISAVHISSSVLLVVGLSSQTGGKGYWLARYNTGLVMISSSNFYQNNCEMGDFIETAGGIFVVGSRAINFLVSNDTWIGKFTSNLVFVTSAAYDGPSAQSDHLYSLAEDGSGGVVVVGAVYTPTIGDQYIAHYDSNLVRVASTTVNGPANASDQLTAIARTAAGNYLVSGVYATSAGLGGANIYLAEYDSSLNKLSSTSYTSSGNASDWAISNLLGANGDVYVAGYAANAGSQDMWLGRFSTNPAYGMLPAGSFAGTAQSSTSIQWSWTDASVTETGYRVMAGAANVSGDLAANTSTWLQTGLAVNTSSGALFVQAFNSTGTTNSGSVTRYSLAAVPAGLGSAGVTASSATIFWSGGATLYQLEQSTGSGFVIVASSAVTSYGNTGLSPASTYYYRVLGLNGDSIATAYTSTITVVTQPGASAPNAPSAFAGVAQSTGSILWSWTDNASTELGFRLMSGATNVSGDLALNATTWLQTGLAVNTSSGSLFVRAFNSTGTADSGSLARYSLAAVPTGLSTSSVFQTSVTVSWTAGNPAGTIFELEISTGAGFALRVSSTAVTYTDAALVSASTYYYRMRALNGDAVASAYASSITIVTQMTPLPGAPTGFAGAAQSGSAILWTWTDNATNETGYRVMSGAVNISTDMSIGTTLWMQTGLSTNTSYGPFFTQAFNAGGTTNSGTASRWTLAEVPTGLAAAGVYQTSGTLSWNAGSNPAGTTFQLERSTGTGYGLLISASATYYFDGYMTPSSTHYYRVRAVNGEAVATAYSSTIAVVAVAAPPVPGSAGTPVGAALGTSSATWTWVLASGATNHYLFRPSDSSYLGSSSSGPFVMTALSPNLPYGLRAAGVNVGGTGPLSPSATVFTLAATPSGAAAVSITSTALVATWSLNGNPGSTVAQLQRSTDAVVYSTLTTAAVASYADADLLGCTTYYYRVRNYNGDGLATPYASFSGVTANTNASPPSGLTATANTGATVSLAWGLSPSEGVTGYYLYWDAGSGTVAYGSVLAVLTSTETAYTTGVLTSSASYTFALRTRHRCGTVETTGALAMSGAAAAAAVVRAAIKEPDSGRRVAGNSVTILGELIAGTPSDVQQIVFQYKLATSTDWIEIDEVYTDNPNPDFSFPYFTHADVTGLATGSYDLRAVAYDRNGVADPAPPAVRVVVDPVTFDIRETQSIDGTVKKEQSITNTVTSVVDATGSGDKAPAVRVTIPVGAVTSASTTVTVTVNPVITTAAPTGQSLIGSAIKIDLSNNQSVLNGTAEIALTYPDTIQFPALLQIYYLNEVTGQWSRDFASTVNVASRTVTGRTSHFSTFAIMLGTAFSTDLETVQVYPVPYKPNGANADEGVPFSNTNANSGIIFAKLTAGSTIKIYTLTGRLVSSLDAPSIAGTVRWDARNQDGRDVASGAYFAVISAAGHKNVIRKLVIIR